GVAAILGPGIGGQLAGWLGLEGMFTVATIGCGLAVLALAWALRRQPALTERHDRTRVPSGS
ncbi:MAG TPA: hypothetical protein VIH33_02165, partial [Candidatus Limnocylindria bacterium]